MKISLLAAGLVLFSTATFADSFFAVSNNSNQSSSVQTITTTGSVSGTVGIASGATSFNNAGLAFGAGGKLFGISNDGVPGDFFLSSINSSTGATSGTVGLGNTLGFEGLAYDPNTQLMYSVGTGAGDSFLYSISGNGQTTQVLDLGSNFGAGFPAGGGLAYDSTNNLFYAISKDGSAVASLYSITLGGTVTDVGILGGGGANTFEYDGGLTFDANNGLLYTFTADQNGGPSTLQAFDVNGNLAGGSVTLSTPAGDSYNGGLAAEGNAVPEPGTIALLLTGLGGAALRFRRRQ